MWFFGIIRGKGDYACEIRKINFELRGHVGLGVAVVRDCGAWEVFINHGV